VSDAPGVQSRHSLVVLVSPLAPAVVLVVAGVVAVVVALIGGTAVLLVCWHRRRRRRLQAPRRHAVVTTGRQWIHSDAPIIACRTARLTPTFAAPASDYDKADWR